MFSLRRNSARRNRAALRLGEKNFGFGENTTKTVGGLQLLEERLALRHRDVRVLGGARLERLRLA